MPGTFFPGNKSKIRVLGTLIFQHAFEILVWKHKLGFFGNPDLFNFGLNPKLFKLIPGTP
jgi:hypothetical protein